MNCPECGTNAMCGSYCFSCGRNTSIGDDEPKLLSHQRRQSYVYVDDHVGIPIYAYSLAPKNEVYYIPAGNLFLVQDAEIFNHTSKAIVCEMLLTKYQKQIGERP